MVQSSGSQDSPLHRQLEAANKKILVHQSAAAAPKPPGTETVTLRGVLKPAQPKSDEMVRT